MRADIVNSFQGQVFAISKMDLMLGTMNAMSQMNTPTTIHTLRNSKPNGDCFPRSLMLVKGIDDEGVTEDFCLEMRSETYNRITRSDILISEKKVALTEAFFESTEALKEDQYR